MADGSLPDPDDLQVEFKARPRVKGEFTLNGGATYVGEYVTEKGKKLREGTGRFQYADGGVFTGGWKEDKMHGKGTYKFATGDVYEGGFVDGMFSGYGAYRFPDGSLYEGEWKDNLMHGAGYYLDKFSRRFEGEFLFGSFNSAANYVSNAPPELNHAADTDLLIQQKLFGGDGGAGVGHDEAGAPALAAWAGGDATPGTIE